jgi:hypothetical protein
VAALLSAKADVFAIDDHRRPSTTIKACIINSPYPSTRLRRIATASLITIFDVTRATCARAELQSGGVTVEPGEAPRCRSHRPRRRYVPLNAQSQMLTRQALTALAAGLRPMQRRPVASLAARLPRRTARPLSAASQPLVGRQALVSGNCGALSIDRS